MATFDASGGPTEAAADHHRPMDSVIDGGDAIVIGAGLAGLYTALALAGRTGPSTGPARAVTLVALDAPGRLASSGWAQGGIAAAMDSHDAPASHARDTCVAGAGIVDPEIADLVARSVPDRIRDLAALGVPFDRTGDGFALGREAAHGAARIVRVTGDRAGAAITGTLGQQVAACPDIRVLTGVEAEELAYERGRVAGVFAVAGATRHPLMIRAPHVVLATGGAGALYGVTTAPLAMLGTGLGLAARAGAQVGDAEFVQFHPTAMTLGRDPAPLATEALRGEGAVLITQSGWRFMPSVHDDAELAPRDVVARAIHARLLAGDRVFLDCRTHPGASFPERFPTVYGYCREAGLDPTREPIPVAPAAHYHMGGVAVDADGATSLPGLWACGEVAATGLHGANRLASNSLAEAVVFGARIAAAIRGATPDRRDPVSWTMPPALATPMGRHASPVVARLRALMTRDVGLIRNRDSLQRAAREIERMTRHLNMTLAGPSVYGNVLAAATLIVAGAAARTESRGGHFRSDHPAADPAWAHRSFTTLAEARARLADLAEQGGDTEVRPGGLEAVPAAGARP